MTDDFRFFYYNSDKSEEDVPIPFSVIADDDLMTLSELTTAVNFSSDKHVYVVVLKYCLCSYVNIYTKLMFSVRLSVCYHRTIGLVHLL